jgi:signal transduction histidine kinase
MKQMQQVIYSQPTLGQELTKAREVINQFINSCSHSLRGPLKSITGLNTIVKQAVKSGNEDPLMYIELIDQSVNKMESLLMQFEQFLETSKSTFTMEPVRLNDIVDEVLANAHASGRTSGIDIDVQINSQDCLYTDHNAVRLVLSNLLENAVIFHDDRKATKKISLVVKVTRACASINIVDNGVGIPTEAQAKIFELFYRGSEKSIGSGVGLYMVQQVLKNLGGSISFHSAEDSGSNFFVWMPNQSNIKY